MKYTGLLLQRRKHKRGSRRIERVCILVLFLVLFSSALISDFNLRERDNPGIVLVIDRSGSMGFFNYMNPAKQRAQIFIGLMEIGDQVGVVSYNEEAEINYSITTITSEAIKTAAQNAVNAIQSEGRTSIGAGLTAGRNQLNSSSATGQKAMILLSDGLDNYAPFAVDVVPSIPSHIDVYTIALGPASDQLLMQWIANQTGGAYYYLPSPAQLQQIYDIISSTLRGYEQYYSQSCIIEPLENVTENISIDSLADYVLFTVASEEEFSAELSALDFVLQTPSGTQINPSNVSNGGYGEYIEGFAYRSYKIINPASGTWQISIINSSSNEDIVYDLSVFGKSGIQMQQTFTQEEYLIEEPLELIVDITAQEIPVSNCIVTATITPVTGNNRANDTVLGEQFSSNPAVFDSRETLPVSDHSHNRHNSDGFARTEIILNMIETAPGRYEVQFFDTELPGSYNVEISAQIEHESILVSRKLISSFYFAPPGAVASPILLQPENYTQDLPIDVEFLWTPVLNADTYRIQIANNEEILFDITGINENNLAVSLPDYNSEYMWRVRALAGDLEGNWSDIFYFTTEIPEVPLPPNLDGYSDSNSIVLNWDAAESHHYHGDPSGYKVYRNEYHYANICSSINTYTDTAVSPNHSYAYYITVLYQSGEESLPSNTITVTFTGVETDEKISGITTIKYNYPNPFNPETKIVFHLEKSGDVVLRVFDIEGRLVRTLLNDYLPNGEHFVVWRGKNIHDRPVPSGVYIVEMKASGGLSHQKILLLK